MTVTASTRDGQFLVSIDPDSVSSIGEALKGNDKHSTLWERNKDLWNFIVQTLGVGGALIGVFLIWHQMQLSVKIQKVTNLHNLKEAHRSIWSLMMGKAELQRLMDEKACPKPSEITLEERIFVGFVILQLQTCYRFSQESLLINIGKLTDDVNSFFSLPVPRIVWDEKKRFHDPDFVNFVEDALGVSTQCGCLSDQVKLRAPSSDIRSPTEHCGKKSVVPASRAATPDTRSER